MIDTPTRWRPGPSAAPADGEPRDDAAVIDDVVMRFSDQLAVDGISLAVPRGTILGVIGPSGAGKTTTIRLLTGALTPTSGKVTVLGEEPRHFRRQTREKIGYMPQSFTLYPDLTVRENVDFVASLFGMLFKRHWRTRQTLKLVDLWDVRGRRAGRLSGGMQRRLELACALVHDPALLFLDEPTAGIDPLLRARIWDELHRLRDAGRTLIVTTQYVNEAEQCDWVALIANGRLLALETPDGLRRKAIGGDVVAVETAAFFDGELLSTLPFVRHVRQDGARRLTVIVDDAGTATPDVVEAVRARGGEVVSAREERPSFDDVFAALIQRDERNREAEEAAKGDHGKDGAMPADPDGTTGGRWDAPLEARVDERPVVPPADTVAPGTVPERHDSTPGGPVA
ncbi:MAG: ABC transporter ATP-binding protein [Chloroflexota bacterium]